MNCSGNDPKIVFLDTEFTGEHAYATLVSLGLVTMDGQELYITLNDYSRAQVTDWLAENVLVDIDPATTVSSKDAYKMLHSFLSEYSQDHPLYIVSCGLLQDYLLLLELYKHATPGREYFHALHCLPPYLNHHAAIDLNTLFRVCGIDPDLDRAKFAGISKKVRRHNALDDALVVRGCFLRLMNEEPVQTLLRGMRL